MRIIGCDLHARQQSLAMLDTTTGEVVNLTLMHEGNNVREFYSQLPRPVLVGIEATGSTAEKDLSNEKAHLRRRTGVLDEEEEKIQRGKKDEEPLDSGRPR